MKPESAAERCADIGVFIALGSNLHNPRQQVYAGLSALGRLPLTRFISASSLYRTAPVGYANQPDFINAVAHVSTTLASSALLEHLLEIERTHGRVRDFANAPRTLDLDILLYGDQRIDESALTIPHPRMHERIFVLAPLTEVAPEITLPGRGRARDLLAMLGTRGVEKLDAAAA